MERLLFYGKNSVLTKKNRDEGEISIRSWAEKKIMWKIILYTISYWSPNYSEDLPKNHQKTQNWSQK